MKNGRRITREMKMFLLKNGLDPKDYLYTKNTTTFYEFLNKVTNERITINKEG